MLRDALQVLVVDDEVDMLRICSNVLTAEPRADGRPVAVETSGTALGARQRLIQSDFDLVILDIKMPGVSGLELMHFALEHAPQAALVLITAYPDYGDTVTAIKEGAFDYLVKPFTASQLADVACRAFADNSLRNEGPRGTDARKTARPADALVGQHPSLKKLRRLIARVSALGENVLLLGETGTGKGLVARILHESGPRRGRPMMTLDCGAIPSDLMESELFGHEKGSFTGADKMRKGLLELAENGSLLLDEIPDLPLQLQSRLLRALQEREFMRVGGTEVKRVHARVISASNRDLKELVRQGKFREDLYYRINVIPIAIPSLRERREDIELLTETFLADFRTRNPPSKIRGFSEEVLDRFGRYPWPGNVRELENVVRRTCALSTGETVTLSDLPEDLLLASQDSGKAGSKFSQARGLWLSHFEQRYFCDVLEQTGGNVVESASISGVPRATLYRYLHKYGLDPAQFRDLSTKRPVGPEALSKLRSVD